MTVRWSAMALDDRASFLTSALVRALQAPDPQIYAAALECDARIESDVNRLEGIATWRAGPLPDSRVYPAADGRFVILYRRDGPDILIERVLPTRSNWLVDG